MEHTNKSTTPSRRAIWFTLGVVILLIVLVVTTKLPNQSDLATPVVSGTEAVCYYSRTETATGLYDVYALKLNVDDAGAATGELVTLPAEKDAMRGTLSGSLNPIGEEYIFKGLYRNSAEGMNNTDERIIRLAYEKASIGYGEMKENADGIYSYANPSQIDYSLSIPRIDCAQYPNTL